MGYYTPQPRDIENQVIDNAISGIPYVQNFTVASGTWTGIYTNVDTKNIILQSRSDYSWMFSTVASGVPYFTVKKGGAIQARLVTVSGTLVGYVSTSQPTEVIELMQGR